MNKYIPNIFFHEVNFHLNQKYNDFIIYRRILNNQNEYYQVLFIIKQSNIVTKK